MLLDTNCQIITTSFTFLLISFFITPDIYGGDWDILLLSALAKIIVTNVT